MFVVFRLQTVSAAAAFQNVYVAGVILCRLCECESSGLSTYLVVLLGDYM